MCGYAVRNNLLNECQEHIPFGSHAEALGVEDEEFDRIWDSLGENSQQLFFPKLVLYEPVRQDRDSGSVEAQALMYERIADRDPATKTDFLDFPTFVERPLCSFA